LKRKFEESLKTRKYWLQVKEIKIKVILYNISRIVSSLCILIFIEEFYRAEIIIRLNRYFVYLIIMIVVIPVSVFFIYLILSLMGSCALNGVAAK